MGSLIVVVGRCRDWEQGRGRSREQGGSSLSVAAVVGNSGRGSWSSWSWSG